MDDRIDLRPASATDAETLLDWRNDPITRRSSRHSQRISHEEHQRWLAEILVEPSRTLLVGLLDDAPFGTVRFDELDGPGRVEVSITVGPTFRGLGLSLPLLLAGERWLSGRDTGRVFWANVDPANSRSESLFRRAGYSPGLPAPTPHGIWLAKAQPPATLALRT